MSNKFKLFEETLLFAKVSEFHDGILSAYEESGVEHGGLEVVETLFSGRNSSIHSSNKDERVKQRILFNATENMVEEIDVDLHKNLYLDENVIGNIYLMFRTSKTYDVNYETGVEIGKGIVDANNFVKEGIGKEILESMILFLFKRLKHGEVIVVHVFKYDTHSVRGYSIETSLVSIKSHSVSLTIYIEIDDVNDLEYINMEFHGKMYKKVELSPELLKNMKDGFIE